MKFYNVDVRHFIRQAIAEKIKREYKKLIPKQKSTVLKCLFINKHKIN